VKPLQQILERIKKMLWRKRLRNVRKLEIPVLLLVNYKFSSIRKLNVFFLFFLFFFVFFLFFFYVVLHKAGRHMEDSMVAAYVALLLGYVVMKNAV
jgi:hypothetical protein